MKKLLFGGARSHGRFDWLLQQSIHMLNGGNKVVCWPCRDRAHSWHVLKQIQELAPTVRATRIVSRRIGQGNYDEFSYWIEIKR